jgi:hypothetical protein
VAAEGAKLYHAGRFSDADRAYRLALDADPNNLDALIGAGVVAVSCNRLGEAKTLLEQAIVRAPDNLRVLLELTETAYRQDDFPGAAVWLRRMALLVNEPPRGQLEAIARRFESFRDASPWRHAEAPQDVRIPFEITDPLPIVKVTLDDRTTVPFLIDTGEHEVGVDRALAQDLGLRTYGSSQGIFAGGKTATINYGRLNTLAMGEFRMHDVPVNIVDVTALGEIGGLPVRGVIGTAFLYHHLSTIDYPGGALILRPRTPERLHTFEQQAAREGQQVVPFWLSGTHYILAWGTFNRSEPMLLFVDTGLQDGAFTAPMSTIKHGDTLRYDEAFVGSGGGGDTTIVPFAVDELTLGPVAGRDLNGFYFPEEADEDHVLGRDFPVGGTISHQFFRPYALTFDFARMRLFLGTPSD